MLSALRTLKDMSDIQVCALVNRTTHVTDNYYRKRPPVVHKPAPARYRPSPELQAIMDNEVKDFWENSPLVSLTERECYYLRMTDRTRYKTCDCESCVHWRFMLMTREERAVHEFERVREVMKSL